MVVKMESAGHSRDTAPPEHCARLPCSGSRVAQLAVQCKYAALAAALSPQAPTEPLLIKSTVATVESEDKADLEAAQKEVYKKIVTPSFDSLAIRPLSKGHPLPKPVSTKIQGLA